VQSCHNIKRLEDNCQLKYLLTIRSGSTHSLNKIEYYGLKATTFAGECQKIFMAAIEMPTFNLIEIVPPEC
jgi:hypothetical protein